MSTSDIAERSSRMKTWHMALQSGAMLLLYIVPQMPRQNVWFPFILGLISLFFFLCVERNIRASVKEREERWFTAALLGFCGYLFVNALWARAPEVALGKAVFVLCLVLLTPFVARAFALQSRETLVRTALLALVGALISSIVTCIEFSTDHIIGRTLYTYVPGIRPGDKTLTVSVMENGKLVELPEAEFRKYQGNVIVDIASAALNRIHSFRLLLLWPILFLAIHYVRPKAGAALAAFLAFAAVYSIFAGESQTAQAALVLSALVFFVAQLWANAVHWFLLGAWCIAATLAIPLAMAPYALDLHKAEWISPSFRDRMIIWEFTGTQAMKSPILGIGIRSTRVLNKEFKKTQKKMPGHVTPMRLGLHSHNNFVQAWFELGAIGALLILAIGIGLLQTIKQLLPPVRPYAYATFVTACIIAAFGWGLWQTWLLSGYALATMMVAFINSYARKVTAPS
ncbi:MAG: O-antigen ligase family protein [Hyphomicrobiaceae bacterium]|nr:O-antigen ligase family protein [Hyphomicrobiaceae bacterium]